MLQRRLCVGRPQQPQYSYRPRANSNIGYVATGGSNPLNPLYAHDESRIFGFAGPEKPGLVVAAKSLGLGIALGSMIVKGYSLTKRDSVSVSPYFVYGLLMYAHPVLGWNHGYLFPNRQGIGGSILKGMVHVAALAATGKAVRALTRKP